MPTIIPRELMILVERVVRPLPIPLKRKQRLRTEFLEHLQAIQAEELARDGDQAAALARTQQRFGDPAELTTELRGTIRWWEPLKSRLEGFMSQRSNESASRYVFRHIRRFVVCLSLLIGLNMMDHHFFGTEQISLMQIQVALGAVIFLAVWLGSFLLFSLHVGSEWNHPRRRWSRIIPFSLGLIASWPISLACLFGVSTGQFHSIPLMVSVLGGLFSAVCGIVVGVIHHRETLYRREWAEIDLIAS